MVKKQNEKDKNIENHVGKNNGKVGGGGGLGVENCEGM
jgi:hypothetical protein